MPERYASTRTLTRAVVAGAGPTGAATALLLARAGVAVTLLERERSFERVFRGQALMPSGADALQDRCPILIMVAAGRNAAICYPTWDGSLQYGLIVRKSAASVVRQPDHDDWVDDLVQSAPRWLAEHVRAQHAEIAGSQRLNVLVGRAASWTLPGVLFLGDAAHPMSPVRAHGAPSPCATPSWPPTTWCRRCACGSCDTGCPGATSADGWVLTRLPHQTRRAPKWPRTIRCRPFRPPSARRSFSVLARADSSRR